MKKILVILPNNLGDVIMALPVLQGLKAKYPESHIAFFAESGFEAGIENVPYCDEIIAFPRKNIRNLLNSSKWEEGAGLAQSHIDHIASRGFDLIINLCQHSYMPFLVTLMKAGKTLGQCFLKEGNHAITDAWSMYLYAIPFSRKSNNLHAVDVYRRIAGVTKHFGAYGIHVTEEEKAWAKKYLTEKGMNINEKIMVFQPGAAFASKIWPIEHFVELGKLCISQGFQILLTGAPSETNNAHGILSGIGARCYWVAGETTFRQSIALCSTVQGCVMGDTALMHAAAGMGIRVYALFGPTSPVETGPYGNGHWVFSGSCPDKPCFKTECIARDCMRTILPSEVFSRIKGESPAISSCDVYRTTLEPSGDYHIAPVGATAFSYWNRTNALLTRKVCGDASLELELDGNEAQAAIKETTEWLGFVESMAEALDNYLKLRNGHSIKEFESLKSSLVGFKGIGEFWTAILNLRLNSVPLLQPLEGIGKSAEVCREVLQCIGDVINNSRLS